MKTRITSDSWGWRERAGAIGIIVAAIIVLLLIATAHVDAAPAAGNRGGCGYRNSNMRYGISCNVSDAGPGFVSGKCDYGYWFSRVSTARTFRIGEIVTVNGCEGLKKQLYAPITIRKAR